MFFTCLVEELRSNKLLPRTLTHEMVLKGTHGRVKKILVTASYRLNSLIYSVLEHLVGPLTSFRKAKKLKNVGKNDRIALFSIILSI